MDQTFFCYRARAGRINIGVGGCGGEALSDCPDHLLEFKCEFDCEASVLVFFVFPPYLHFYFAFASYLRN